MFIQTEETPNPATMKFLPGRTVMASGTADFKNPEQAASSPLVQRLFAIDGVSGVFLGSDFIAVTKADEKEWSLLKPPVLGAIMDHFSSGQPVIEETAKTDGEKSDGEKTGDDEVVAQIKELLDTRIRPAVAGDGGDIVFHRFENGVVYLHMQGACAGCPSATATLKHGIENMLRYYIPEVEAVEAV